MNESEGRERNHFSLEAEKFRKTSGKFDKTSHVQEPEMGNEKSHLATASLRPSGNESKFTIVSQAESGDFRKRRLPGDLWKERQMAGKEWI